MFATTLSAHEQLQATIQGAVILPDSDQYAAARRAWNLTVDQHPALIVLATCVHDVVEAVRYASEAGLPVAVQATGHGMRRPADGALLINTAQLNAVTVDPVKRTAWIEAGAKWKVVLAATQAVGLAPLLGSHP